MTGITRSAAAKIIAEHFDTSAVHVGGTYDTYTVEDDTGRKWKVVSDASIQCQSRGERTASRLYAVEVVSPICKYEDIETIQQLVRELRRGGAKVNDSCGIHIHVDASRHDPKTLRNIVNIMASKEDLLYKALNVQIDRECYCQKADLRFLEDVNLKHPKSMAEFETLWYNGDSRRNVHYDYSRYHALNLHSVFSKGTVEFRMFNSTLHAGEVKCYYNKEQIPVKMDDGSSLTGMVYIMDPRMDFGNPSKNYYDIVRQGYEDCGLDTNVLDHAVNDSMDLAQQRMECEGMRFF